jgi:hypothetical protein
MHQPPRRNLIPTTHNVVILTLTLSLSKGEGEEPPYYSRSPIKRHHC